MSIQIPFASLRRVYVRPPVADDLERWRTYDWRSAPDPVRAAQEHTALREALAAAGAEIVIGTAPTPGDPDAIYTYDPSLVTDDGAILLRPGKVGRRGEPDAIAEDLQRAGLAVIGRLTEPATAEGGDMFFLDEGTLLIGRGYRTNDAGIEQLRGLLPRVEVAAFDLPHLHGPEECLHLMSLISPLAVDLVVGSTPMMPVRLVELLRDREISIVEVHEGEFDSMGANVLALGPRIALALEGNPMTRRALEAAGVDVRTYIGAEISRKGDGGPTCLTRPLERG